MKYIIYLYAIIYTHEITYENLYAISATCPYDCMCYKRGQRVSFKFQALSDKIEKLARKEIGK